MDWTVYWFMLPVCVGVAGVAMFSGISGAALLTPIFLIGFPFFGIPQLSTAGAIGTALFLETSGFGAGVVGYLRRGLVDVTTARRLVVAAVPATIVGALLSATVPDLALKLAYGTAMVALAAILFTDRRKLARPVSGPAVVAAEETHLACGHGLVRHIRGSNGEDYQYCAHGLRGQAWLSGIGGLAAGLISTGIGESTLPGLVRRSKFPVAVAAATSTLVVAATVVVAAAAHLTRLVLAGGLAAVPWNLLVWAVPGALIGARIGTGLQGRVSEHAARLFFSALFLVIGAAFLIVFGLLGGRLR